MHQVAAKRLHGFTFLWAEPVANPPLPALVHAYCYGAIVEEWGFLDERELDSFRGHKSCATCDHFGYVTLGQCQVLGSCSLKQGLLAPGSHPLKSCKHWTYCSAVDPYR